MKCSSVFKALATLAISGVAVCFFPGNAPADGNGQCCPSSVAGSYGFSTTGFTVAGDLTGPTGAVGRARLFSDGRVRGSQTFNINGNIFEETFEGTFTVNPDCTGSTHVVNTGTIDLESNFDVVWINNKTEARLVSTDPEFVLVIDAKKL